MKLFARLLFIIYLALFGSGCSVIGFKAGRKFDEEKSRIMNNADILKSTQTHFGSCDATINGKRNNYKSCVKEGGYKCRNLDNGDTICSNDSSCVLKLIENDNITSEINCKDIMEIETTYTNQKGSIIGLLIGLPIDILVLYWLISAGQLMEGGCENPDPQGFGCN